MQNAKQTNSFVNLNPIPKRLVRLFSKAIAKLILKFNLNKNDYNHYLNEQLVLEAKRQNPKATIVEISVRTGINRRYIKDYLKGEMPNIKSNKLTLILSDMKWTLNKYYGGGKKLPKKGPFASFQSICEQWTPGMLTYQAILSELVRIGSVIDHGEKVELVVAKKTNVKELIQGFDITSTLLDRYANTIMRNLENIDDELKNYQMSALSTQINPKDIVSLKAEIRSVLQTNSKNIIKLLEKYESNVKPDTYPAYGVSVFEFNDNENDNMREIE